MHSQELLRFRSCAYFPVLTSAVASIAVHAQEDKDDRTTCRSQTRTLSPSLVTTAEMPLLLGPLPRPQLHLLPLLPEPSSALEATTTSEVVPEVVVPLELTEPPKPAVMARNNETREADEDAVKAASGAVVRAVAVEVVDEAVPLTDTRKLLALTPTRPSPKVGAVRTVPRSSRPRRKPRLMPRLKVSMLRLLKPGALTALPTPLSRHLRPVTSA